MERKYRYLHCCILIILVVSFTSCNGQKNTRIPKGSTKNTGKIIDSGLGLPKTADEMNSFLEAGIDPYFVETKDTISRYGPTCIVRQVIQDKKGDFWFATWNGIVKYDGTVFTNYTLKESLIHFHVVTLYEDSKGYIWFSLARAGVYLYDGNSFKLFTSKDGLADNTTNCIAEDKNGNIWFGTENGASRFDGKTFMNFTKMDGLADNFINSIMSDKNGMIWFGTNHGISILDGKKWIGFPDRDTLNFKQVSLLFEDRIGNIWIASGAKAAGGNGLCRYDGMSLKPLITPYYVMYMCEDKKGKLWFAHNKGAGHVQFSLYSYDGKTITKIVEQDQASNPVIFGILEDRNHHIWFGTSKGVCRFDGTFFDYFSK